MKFLLLEVIGNRQYRGHQPGEQFVTRIDPALQRGINRGNVKVLAETEPDLRDGAYGLPRGWPPPAATHQHTEAPQGASLVSEGGKKK